MTEIQFTSTIAKPDILSIHPNGVELLRITPTGEVIAPTLEAASEAGRYFVEAIREQIEAKPIDAKPTPVVNDLVQLVRSKCDDVLGRYTGHYQSDDEIRFALNTLRTELIMTLAPFGGQP